MGGEEGGVWLRLRIYSLFFSRTITIITAFLATICDSGLPPVNHPFEFGSAAVLARVDLWPHADADNDISL